MEHNRHYEQEEYEGIVDEHLLYYGKQVTDNSRWHNGLQLIILLGSIMLPFLVGNAGMVQEAHLPLWIPITLSIIVAIAAGIDGYFKFGDTCSTFRSVCQLITREKRWYHFKIEPYQNEEDDEKRFQMFKKRVELYMNELYPSQQDHPSRKETQQIAT